MIILSTNLYPLVNAIFVELVPTGKTAQFVVRLIVILADSTSLTTAVTRVV